MKRLKIVGFLVVVLLFSGCELDQMLENQPPHLITAETLYKDLAGIETGINGLYALVRENNSSSPNRVRMALWQVGTDNLVVNYETGSGFWNIAQAWESLNNSTYREYEDTFTWMYRIINAANTVINRADEEDVDWSGGNATPEENRNRVVAEAKFFRAWAYRYLMYGWGDVPLNLNETLGSTVKTDWERTPVEQVREQIIADLEFASEYLPVEPELDGKITRGAAQTYLAEMYLLIDNPATALEWANKAINTPEYGLITQRYGVDAGKPGVAFMDMFQEGNINRSEGNSEALWVWQYEYNVVGGGGNFYRVTNQGRYNTIKVGAVQPLQLTGQRGGRGIARQSMTKFAIDLYEAQDERGSPYAIRKFFILRDETENAPYAADKLPEGYSYGDTIWLDWSEDITRATQFRADWPYTRKWEAGPDPADIAAHFNFADLTYIRLAETYLLKAEAQHLLGDNAGAAETINALRRRANASEVSAGDITIDFILDERSRELITEEDRRWTLLRTDKWLERTALHNHNGGEFITERDKLFPIPQAMIDANLTTPMEQNPGFD